MRLQGDQFRQLQQALLDAYPNRESLREMVRLELNEAVVVLEDKNLRATINSLISWAESKDQVKQLIEGARQQNSTNLLLQKAEDDLLRWLSDYQEATAEKFTQSIETSLPASTEEQQQTNAHSGYNRTPDVEENDQSSNSQSYRTWIGSTLIVLLIGVAGYVTWNSMGQLVYHYDFDQKEGWILGKQKYEMRESNYEITAGKLRKTDTFHDSWYDWTPLAPGVTAKNFDMQIETKIIEASDIEKIEIVLSFRTALEDFAANTYLVHFGTKGYKIGGVKDGKWFTVRDWVEIDSFDVTPGRLNTFRIVAKDADFFMFVNDEELLPSRDQTLNNPGGIGFGLGTGYRDQTVTAIADFDNLIIKVLD